MIYYSHLYINWQLSATSKLKLSVLARVFVHNWYLNIFFFSKILHGISRTTGLILGLFVLTCGHFFSVNLNMTMTIWISKMSEGSKILTFACTPYCKGRVKFQSKHGKRTSKWGNLEMSDCCINYLPVLNGLNTRHNICHYLGL